MTSYQLSSITTIPARRTTTNSIYFPSTSIDSIPSSPVIENKTTTDNFDFSSNAPSRRNSSVLSLNKHFSTNTSSTTSLSNPPPPAPPAKKYSTHKKSFSLVREVNNAGTNGTITPPRSPIESYSTSASDAHSQSSDSSSYFSIRSTINNASNPTLAPNPTSYPNLQLRDKEGDEDEDEDYDENEDENKNISSSRTSISIGFPFVRALHTFDPSSLDENGVGNDDASSLCLPFEESDIALLHSVHASGWGDATILNTGIRGWIPTNYFVAYSDPKVIPLLSAILNFVTKPKSFELNLQSQNLSSLNLNPNVKHYTFSQASITNIVSGVRSLLEACGTLTRDTPTVKKSQTIRKFRKALLAELAILVSLAKQHRNSTDDQIVQRLVNGCYKIAAKAVVFLDVWVIDTNVLDDLQQQSNNNIGDRQSVDTMTAHTYMHGAITAPASPGHNDEQGANDNKMNSVLTTNVAAPIIPLITSTTTTTTTITGLDEQSNKNVVGSRTQAMKRSGSTGTTIAISKNRESVIFHSLPPTARQRLDEVNEALTAYLGVFIHRMSFLESDPSASTTILVNTRKSMLACRELLAVVESISSRQQPRNRELEQTKDKLFAQIKGLVTSARDVVAYSPMKEHKKKPSDGSTSSSGYGEVSDVGKKLIENATDCARTAGECVVRCRNLLNKLPGGGDFQLSATREYPDFSDGVIAVPNYRVKTQSIMTSLASPVSTIFSPTTDDPGNRASRINFMGDRFLPSALNTTTIEASGNITSPLPTGSSGHSVHSNGLLPQIPSLSPIIPIQPITDSSPTDSYFKGEKEKSHLANGTSVDEQEDNSNQVIRSQPSELELRIIYDANDRIRGASVEALIYVMTDETKEEDKFLISTFFLSFRYFTSAQEVCEALISRFAPDIDEDKLDLQDLEDISSRRVKVYNLFKLWLESHWKQSTDGVVLDMIVDLADSHFAKVLPNARSVIHDLASKVVSSALEDGEPIISRPVYLPVISKTESIKNNLSARPSLANLNAGSSSTSLSKHQITMLHKANDVNGYRTNFTEEKLSEAKENDDIKSMQSASTWSTSFRLVRNSTFSSSNEKANGVTLSILDFEPQDIATQLTVLDSMMFCKLQPEEFLGRNFELKKRKLGVAPNIGRMASFSNQLSSFVGDTILIGELPPKQRKNILKHWIKISEKCYELGNFNSMIGIISVLQGVNILRLKRTWELLSPRYHGIFNSLREISSPERNFYEYRQQIRQHQQYNDPVIKRSTKPCIPFLGVYLSDLTFLDEGNAKTRDYQSNDEKIKVINFDLYERVARIVGEIQQFQVCYKPPASSNAVSKELQIWLRGEMLKAHTTVSTKGGGDELWRRSCIVEPKR